MQRPSEREFLQAVLREIEDLPAGLAERLAETLEKDPADRAEAIRRLFEEFARG